MCFAFVDATSKGVFMATQLNSTPRKSTELNSGQRPVYDVINKNTTDFLRADWLYAVQLGQFNWVQLSWVELCRYKQPPRRNHKFHSANLFTGGRFSRRRKHRDIGGGRAASIKLISRRYRFSRWWEFFIEKEHMGHRWCYAVAASASINFRGDSFSRGKKYLWHPFMVADWRQLRGMQRRQKIAQFIYPTCIQSPRRGDPPVGISQTCLV